MLFKSVFFRRNSDSDFEIGLLVARDGKEIKNLIEKVFDCKGNPVKKAQRCEDTEKIKIYVEEMHKEEFAFVGTEVEFKQDKEFEELYNYSDPEVYCLRVNSIMYKPKGSEEYKQGYSLVSIDREKNDIANVVIIDDKFNVVTDREDKVILTHAIGFSFFCGKNVF